MAASGHEMAARVRAARGYAGLKALDLAKALNVSVETMSRIENGRRPVAPEEREKIVTACKGVPDWFIEDGWEGGVTSGTRQPDLVLRNQQGELLALVEVKAMRQAPPNTWIAIQDAMVGALRGVGLDAHSSETAGTGTSDQDERLSRIERQLTELSRAVASQALRDAQQRRQSAETSPAEEDDRDARGEGGEG